MRAARLSVGRSSRFVVSRVAPRRVRTKASCAAFSGFAAAHPTVARASCLSRFIYWPPSPQATLNCTLLPAAVNIQGAQVRSTLGMGTKLVERIVETIRRHDMLRPGDRVGVGVSGGADSVALLLLLDELKAALGISLVVVHFNHCLRGMDSDADEHFVATLATAKKLEFASAREDVAARA